jgi:hypothetical protein
MILQSGSTTNCSRRARRLFWAAAGGFLLVAALGGCADDPPAATDPLCGGDFGVGMRVEGHAEPIEVCVSDADVSALLTSLSRYDVAAQMQTDDGIFQLRMVFAQQAAFPVSLRIVGTLAEATADPGTAWVYYEEIPDGGIPIESAAVTGGSFRLSFSDDTIAVGFFENVDLSMEEVLTGDPAGKRRIVRGEFSISVESAPTTTTALP